MAVDNDTRKKNKNWWTHIASTNSYESSLYYQYASLAVLMDIRDELQRLNMMLGCTNFQRIPFLLTRIMDHTKARKYKKRDNGKAAG